MNADDFNAKFKEIVAIPLSPLGFEQLGRNLLYRRTTIEIALIRCNGGMSAMAQIARFIVCVRHVFLRNLERQIPNGIAENPNDYPFKLRLSEFARFSRWRYRPINLGIREYDEIEYGSLKSVNSLLKKTKFTLESYTPNWVDLLTPEKALSQIKRFGENAYCERIWIEDYEKFLSAGHTS